MIYQKIMEDNKLLHFLQRHWFKIVVGFCITASLGGWGERFFKKQKNQNAHDFKTADLLLERVRAGEPLSVEAIEIVENILKRHPELHPKYDLYLAYCMMHQHNAVKAASYSTSAMERTSFAELPFYHDFAKTSKLILEKRYIEAHEQAFQLETQLKNQPAFQELRTFNLVRLLCLSENSNEAEPIWKSLQAQPNYAELESIYKIGEFTLPDFVYSRFNLQDNLKH